MIDGSACRWCGAPLVGATRLRNRLRCAGCGVASTHPFPTEAALDAAYAGAYRPPSGRFSGVGDALLARSRGQLALRLDRIAPPGAVLDVGAGDGALLDALAARGRRAVGLERAGAHPLMRAGELTDPDLELEEGFGAIVFWHSLEHLPEPDAALARAAALLAPGGVLVIAVPNNASLQASVFGDRWLALDLPRHLTHITSSALLAKLADLRLTVERVSYWRGGQVMFGWLHGLVGMLPGSPSLYDAVRRPEARFEQRPRSQLLKALAAGVALAPVAMLASGAEIALRRGGTVYVEARRGWAS